MGVGLANGRFELTATVPAGTRADVALPTAALDAVTENGRPLSELRARDVRRENGRVSFTVPAGSYKFSTPAPR